MSWAFQRSIPLSWRPLLWLLVTVCVGCAPFHRWKSSPLEHVTVPHRDTETANRKHQRALHLIEKGHTLQAEQRLQEAILADDQFGPAYNNLGQIHYKRGRYYEAAWEFEAAANLMPNRPEPINNLGLVYEAARRFSDATQSYQMAHDLEPTNPVYLGNLIRSMLRDDESDQEALGYLLSELLLIETRPGWRLWALQQHAAVTSKADD